MLKGFKDFIMQGNVIDLAVAVVIGAAFTAIVDAFTTAIINPIIALLGGYGVGIMTVTYQQPLWVGILVGLAAAGRPS